MQIAAQTLDPWLLGRNHSIGRERGNDGYECWFVLMRLDIQKVVIYNAFRLRY